MLFNHEQPFEELEWKRMYCWDWGVQVTNCRYRPYDQLYDYFNGNKKSQTNEDYYIHPNWSDLEIKQFNRNVRRHNMTVRFRSNYHSLKMENKKLTKELHNEVRFMKYSEAIQHLDDAWNPQEYHGVENG